MSTRALARAGITLRIRRQDTRAAMPHWEVFEVPLAPRLTLAEVLDRLAFLPLNARRERVAPVSYTWGSVFSPLMRSSPGAPSLPARL